MEEAQYGGLIDRYYIRNFAITGFLLIGFVSSIAIYINRIGNQTWNTINIVILLLIMGYIIYTSLDIEKKKEVKNAK
jgi:uncharacterized membrane protein YjjP (DUF1212 family)